MSRFDVSANLVDLENRRLVGATISVDDGRIASIIETGEQYATYLLAGFVDAHVHIESSMLTPSAFGRAAVCHGTVGTVSDPHEIANVLGLEGVGFMLDDAQRTPLKIHFGAPSCVPASAFETSGAEINPDQVSQLLQDPRIGYLSEMMNFPGVLANDAQVREKMDTAKRLGLPIDGHAPGLRGEDANRYVQAGITTDHECATAEEARDKLDAGRDLGFKLQIREGSAARNFDALHPLLEEYPDRVMFASDDKHPDELRHGHINRLCARAVGEGHDLFTVLRAGSKTPVDHYGLTIGQLRAGDPADFIEVDSLETFNVQRTWINGQLVAKQGEPLLDPRPVEPINQFAATAKVPADFHVSAQGGDLRVIEVRDGQLVTGSDLVQPKVVDRAVVADPERDLLKIAVVNRYADTDPAVGFVRGFGMKRGAIASSVAHDSHNVIAVGVSDDELTRAVNAVIASRGGLAAVEARVGKPQVLALEVAGLMTTDTCEQTAVRYEQLDAAAKHLGSTLRAPYMTLSFLALLVIPTLKLSDQGLFDGEQFALTSLFTSSP